MQSGILCIQVISKKSAFFRIVVQVPEMFSPLELPKDGQPPSALQSHQT
jgi:hypothetical protein